MSRTQAYAYRPSRLVCGAGLWFGSRDILKWSAERQDEGGSAEGEKVPKEVISESAGAEGVILFDILVRFDARGS